jgi:hypothetical protein
MGTQDTLLSESKNPGLKYSLTAIKNFKKDMTYIRRHVSG